MPSRQWRAVAVCTLALCLSGCDGVPAAGDSKTDAGSPARYALAGEPGPMTERLAALYGGEENFRTLCQPDRVEATVLITSRQQVQTLGPFDVPAPQVRELIAIFSREANYRWDSASHSFPEPNIALRFIRGEAHLDLFYGWNHDVLFIAQNEHLVGQCEASVAPAHDRLMIALNRAVPGLSAIAQIP